MDDADFLLKRQKAIERMRELERSQSDRRGAGAPQTPPFVKMPGKSGAPSDARDRAPDGKNGDRGATPLFDLPKFDFPILDKLRTDRDAGLILGLVLLLLCENGDRLTMIALLYILL